MLATSGTNSGFGLLPLFLGENLRQNGAILVAPFYLRVPDPITQNNLFTTQYQTHSANTAPELPRLYHFTFPSGRLLRQYYHGKIQVENAVVVRAPENGMFVTPAFHA